MLFNFQKEVKSYAVSHLISLVTIFLEYRLDTEIITCALEKYRRELLLHLSKEFLHLGRHNIFK